MRNMLKKFSSSAENKTFSFLGLEYLIKIVLGTIVGVWVARYLGPARYGNLAYILSFVLIFTPFFTMTNEELLIKELVENKDSHSEVMGAGFITRLLGSFFAILIVNISAFYIAPKIEFIRYGILVFSIMMSLKAFQVIDNYYLSISKVKVISFSRNLVMVILSILKIYLIVQKREWIDFVYVSCLELVFNCIFYSIVYFRSGYSIFIWKINSSYIKRALQASTPLVLISFCTVGVGKLDQIMIMNFSGNEELGKYAVSVKLIELWQFVPLAFISSLYPKIVENHSTSQDKYQESLNKLYGLITIFAFSLAIGTSIFSNIVVDLLYGDLYEGAGPILALYSWTILLSYLTLARNKVFIIEKLLKIELGIVTTTLVLNALINYYLIPKYGAKGAVFASIVSYLIANIIWAILNKKVARSIWEIFRSVKYIKVFFKSILGKSE